MELNSTRAITLSHLPMSAEVLFKRLNYLFFGAEHSSYLPDVMERPLIFLHIKADIGKVKYENCESVNPSGLRSPADQKFADYRRGK